LAEHQHLPLPSARIDLERRKKGGFPGAPERDTAIHAASLTADVTRIVEAFREQKPIGPVQPSFIMKVETASYTADSNWAAADLTVLATDADQTLVVLSHDKELTSFRERLEKYAAGPAEDKVTAPYANLIAPLEEVKLLEPGERIGELLRDSGVDEPAKFEVDAIYSLDVEIWEIPNRNARLSKIDDIAELIESLGGEVLDRYIGGSMTLLRVRGPGLVFSTLAELTDVRQIELPPMVDRGIEALMDLGLHDFPEIVAPPDDAPSVTIIDSGVASAHPLLEAALGECIAIPHTLTPDDLWGHGTKVAGVAVYGSVRNAAEIQEFTPGVRLHSASVLKPNGNFPDDMLVTTQMRDAITHFREEHGCRVFNISLGDWRTIWRGKKVSTWAAVLDELARELDVVIVVSAGNLTYRGANAESPLHDYPAYLLEPESSIYEPASAALALTVGSLSHAAAVPETQQDLVRLRPIAPLDGPSPFTRCGPEEAGCSKPDLCDYGGNLTFDGTNQIVSRNWPPNSILTLNSDYLRQLFTTTIGTSLAAPLVAYKAAILAHSMPDSSANLIRALLAASANVPAGASEVLKDHGEDAVRRVCGAGVPDLGRAMYSDDHRVTLFADTSINQDQFYVYEIPIVEEFSQTRGIRHITVSLAFDPPVRHTRADYLGNRMSFRLVRGASLEEITEFYRKRSKEEGPVPERGSMRECNMTPSSTRREMSTLQKARFTMRINPADYGDIYYLVVRCEGRWAPIARQRFAAVVTIEHENVAELYNRVSERVRQRDRARA
jgi:hypothetical protein